MFRDPDLIYGNRFFYPRVIEIILAAADHQTDGGRDPGGAIPGAASVEDGPRQVRS